MQIGYCDVFATRFMLAVDDSSEWPLPLLGKRTLAIYSDKILPENHPRAELTNCIMNRVER